MQSSFEEKYFDHDADIGIIGRGKTLEQSFEEGARTMFALMGDLSSIRKQQTITVEFDEPDIELAFVTWLNLLLAQADADNLILAYFSLQKKGHHWQGQGCGEVWRDEMERGIDVKGATLTMLSVKKTNDYWEARCVVDV